MNLALTLLAAAERHGDGEALVDGEYRADYASLQRRAAELAGGLAELGLKQGEPLCVLLGNRHETVELYWATQWLGARFVPLNFRLSPDEVRYCVQDAEASIRGLRGRLVQGRACVPRRRRHRCSTSAATTTADVPLSDLTGDHPGALDLDEGEISLMLYTSGTTGKPKGVPRSHRADRAGGLSQVIHHGYRWADRSLGVMPLYHTMGMHTMIAMALIDGCYRGHAAAGTRRPPRTLIAQERISSLYLAPTLFHDLLAALPDDADLSSVESIGYAGSPMTPELAARCAEAFQRAGVLQPLRLHRVLHVGDQPRPGGQARMRGTSGDQQPSAHVRADEDATADDLVAPGEEGQVIADLRSDEAFSRLLESARRRRAGDPRRLVLPGRHRPGSTRTGSSGSSAASTT